MCVVLHCLLWPAAVFLFLAIELDLHTNLGTSLHRCSASELPLYIYIYIFIFEKNFFLISSKILLSYVIEFDDLVASAIFLIVRIRA